MDKIGFGVIGAGGIARRKTIPAMLQVDSIDLRAVMDPVGCEEIAAEFGVPRACETVEELLADPAIQAVYIASPVFLHLDQIRACAAAGKHVLCEKPLTRTVAEAREAVAACRQAGVFLQEGYMMKFHSAHRAIREAIMAGRIGRIVSMRAQLSCWYPPIPDAWRQDPAMGGGGSLIDLATHLYDLLEYFAGPIGSIVALADNLVQDYPSEDSATTLLRFASGCHATIDTFFCVPDEASRTRLEIYGSQGSILAEGTIGQSVGGTVEILSGVGTGGYDAAQNKDVERAFQPLPFEPINPYAAECAAFAESILAGRPPELNSGENGVHIMQLAELAYASARDGIVKHIG